MPTKRMHRGLVTLSAAAVAAVYMAGYLRTQSADASIGAAGLPTAESSALVVAAAPPVLTPTPGSPLGAASGAASSRAATSGATAPRATSAPASSAPARTAPPRTATPAPAAAQQTQGTYKDGTYSGQGSSRRGNVWVSVVIQGGQVANVTITKSTLQYPLRDIAGLPAQVVQRQSAQVDTVSRATYSSQAFKGAVSQALSQALSS